MPSPCEAVSKSLDGVNWTHDEGCRVCGCCVVHASAADGLSLHQIIGTHRHSVVNFHDCCVPLGCHALLRKYAIHANNTCQSQVACFVYECQGSLVKGTLVFFFIQCNKKVTHIVDKVTILSLYMRYRCQCIALSQLCPVFLSNFVLWDAILYTCYQYRSASPVPLPYNFGAHTCLLYTSDAADE